MNMSNASRISSRRNGTGPRPKKNGAPSVSMNFSIELRHGGAVLLSA
jgi:hypothetical protein